MKNQATDPTPQDAQSTKSGKGHDTDEKVTEDGVDNSSHPPRSESSSTRNFLDQPAIPMDTRDPIYINFFDRGTTSNVGDPTEPQVGGEKTKRTKLLLMMLRKIRTKRKKDILTEAPQLEPGQANEAWSDGADASPTHQHMEESAI
ncbi:hypothetical protein BS17DRAFT_781350 [Gyrodon lividus]|nr:hypothetical protein BS17DRAFT_781350 [Gyrodon lividus]